MPGGYVRSPPRRDGRTGRALAVWELYRRGFDTHHIFSVDEYYWEDRPAYYAALDAVRREGDDLTHWLEYCAVGLRQTLDRIWLRIQTFQLDSPTRLVLRPKQERLLQLLRDHGSMAPSEIWASLDVSRQGAMDLLNPLLEAGLVEKIGGFRGEAKFSTWLCGIVFNACRDHHRRRRSFSGFAQKLSVLAGLTQGPDGRGLHDRMWIESAVSRLKPAYRDTVVLVAGQQLSHAEAAEILGVTESTVSWRMHEVRKMLSGE